MNLSDMAAYVCAKVRHTDAASLSVCKGFLKQRDEMIYNDQLWKDSVGAVDITFDPVNNALHAQGIYLLPSIVDKVIAARLTDQNLIAEHPEYFYRIDLDEYAASGQPSRFHTLSPVAYQLAVANGFTVRGSGTDDECFFRWTDDNGELHSATISVVGAPTVITDGSSDTNILTIDAVAKPPATVGDIILTSGGLDVLTIPLASTFAPLHLRFRLIERPTISTPVKILCKRKHVPLTDDNDEPVIQPSVNCLMAFAQVDMLERERQYGKAQAVAQEGQALLEQLKSIEVVQRADHARLIPDETMDNWEWQTKGYW